jgi:hypothetical protein
MSEINSSIVTAQVVQDTIEKLSVRLLDDRYNVAPCLSSVKCRYSNSSTFCSLTILYIDVIYAYLLSTKEYLNNFQLR